MLCWRAFYRQIAMPGKADFVRRKQLRILAGAYGKVQAFLRLKLVKVEGKEQLPALKGQQALFFMYKAEHGRLGKVLKVALHKGEHLPVP